MAVVDKPTFASLSISLGLSVADQLKLELEEPVNDTEDTDAGSTGKASYIIKAVFHSTPVTGAEKVSTESSYGMEAKDSVLGLGGVNALQKSSFVSRSTVGAVEGKVSYYIKGETTDDETDNTPPEMSKNVRMFPVGSGSKIYVNQGSARVVATNVPLFVIDRAIEFVGTSEATLRYSADSGIHWFWVGTPTFEAAEGEEPGGSYSPVFDKDRVILPFVCKCGVLFVSYTTYFDRILVTRPSTDVKQVLLVAEKPNPLDPDTAELITGLMVTFDDGSYTDDDDDGEDGPDTDDPEDPKDPPPATHKDVIFSVVDYCTDEPVDGVSVSIGGGAAQVTNAKGICVFQRLEIGRTYPVRMSKQGYLNSDTDSLNNDSFTVS